MLIYTKVLQQNGKFQFEPVPIPETEDITKAIKSFFSNREAGVHVAVVCTNKSDEVMSEESFRAALCAGGDRQVQPVPTDGAKLSGTGSVYAHHISEFIGQALAEVLKCAKQVIDERYVDNNVEALIQALATFEEQGLYPLENFWIQTFATSSSVILNTAQLKADQQITPDIRILLILPKSHFDTFSNPQCYFPAFLEYVVLGENGEILFQEYQKLTKRTEAFDQANQELEEKKQELEGENRELREENKELKKEKQKLEKENQELKEKNLQLEISGQAQEDAIQKIMEILQQINTHDRFRERPETTMQPDSLAYWQSSEKRSAIIEEASGRKEKQDQMEPSGYEAQASKLSERTSAHFGGKDRRLETGMDHTDRSDDRGDMGR